MARPGLPVHRLVQDEQFRVAAGRRPPRGADACPSSTRPLYRRPVRPNRPWPATARSAGPRPRPARRPAGEGCACWSGADGSGARRRSPRPGPGPWPRSAGTGVPSSDIVPALALVRPSKVRISVVLAAPFGPKEPKAEPRGTSNSTSLTATVGPNRLLRPWVSTAHPLSGRDGAGRGLGGSGPGLGRSDSGLGGSGLVTGRGWRLKRTGA